MSPSLFSSDDLPPEPPKVEQVARGGKPRLRVPVRNQIEFGSLSLDDRVEPEHPVRAVWEFVDQLDLSPWLNVIEAVEGNVGRDKTDPRVPLAVLMYGIVQGVSATRVLEANCRDHNAYLWICGGVSVSYGLLNQFRLSGGDKLKQVLIKSVASLMEQGLVTLTQVAQDGMRVRANAGAGSFRSKTRLEECLEEVTAQVEALERLSEEETSNPRKTSARKRAAEERKTRLQQAITNCEELLSQREEIATKSGREPKPPRASTTDPEARVMKMANGGFNPAYNVILATDVETGIIADVLVTNAGSDSKLLVPMLDLLQEDYEHCPDEMLVDGGFANLDQIATAERRGCKVFAPVKDAQKQLDQGKDPYEPKKGDPPGVQAWRQRMKHPESQSTYRLRSQTAEWVNAQFRNRNLRQMPLRGLEKCSITALLHALVHNFTVVTRLRAKENPNPE
jgi:transposase